jgi:hypothetical protein
MMFKMTKIEAADNIANQVIAFAVRTGQPVNSDSVWAALSECGAGHRGEYLAASAKAANHKTVTRLVRKNLAYRPELLGVLA